jgi:hypothetical protein
MPDASKQNPLLPSDLPHLSDAAAVEVLDFLHELIFRFEAHYSGQIHRHYDQQRRDECTSPIAASTNHSEPTF